MHLLIISAILGCVVAAPQYGGLPQSPPSPPSYAPPPPPPPSPPSYAPPPPPPPSPPSYAPPPPPPSNIYGNAGSTGGCTGDEVWSGGRCVKPVETISYFVFNAPPRPAVYDAPPIIPPPKIDYNVVFVKTPEKPKDQEPIVVPPPQQKTIVYVLNKNGQLQGQRVIELPAGPKHSPEVYYINYDEGANPVLPAGITLQEALSKVTAQQGKVIDGGAGGQAGNAGGLTYGGNGAASGGRWSLPLPINPIIPANPSGY